jgi:uncharacterized protein (UPF0212 family)
MPLAVTASSVPKKGKKMETARRVLDNLNTCPECGIEMEEVFVNATLGKVKARVCTKHRVCLPMTSDTSEGAT